MIKKILFIFVIIFLGVFFSTAQCNPTDTFKLGVSLIEEVPQRICHNCGSIVDIDSAFCANCGTKYEEEAQASEVQVQEEPQEVETPVQEVAQRICHNCGAVVDEEFAFCIKCGSKYEEFVNQDLIVASGIIAPLDCGDW